MITFLAPDLRSGPFLLSAEEAKHCLRVCRHQSGDAIHVTDGLGQRAKVRLTSDNLAACSFDIVERQAAPDTEPRIVLAMAVTKNAARTEWCLEKSVELGIKRFVPLYCRHSERSKINHERLKKIAVAAMKQSLRSWLPEICEIQKLDTWLKLRHAETQYIMMAGAPRLIQPPAQGDICVLVGPEGDFHPDEIKMAESQGFMPASLSAARLRTETAGLAAVFACGINDG